MLSSAGWPSPEIRSRLALAAVALAALAVALVLAFASVTVPRTMVHQRSGTAVQKTPDHLPAAAPAAQPPAASTATGVLDERPLWPLLAPWAVAVDVIAALGLVAVLIVRATARRRRGVRR